jgi:hypothetical protein
MRKATVVGLVLAISLVGFSPASAATKATLVTAAFKTLLNTTGDSLDLLDQKYESDVDLLDSALTKSTLEANSTYNLENSAASNLYLPQITASNSTISASKTKFATLQVKVTSLGNLNSNWENRVKYANYFGNLKCPILRPNCLDPGDKGEAFVVGEITTFKEVIATNIDAYGLDVMVSSGLIEILSLSDFQTTTASLRNEPVVLVELQRKLAAAQLAAKTKKDKAISSAQANRNALLSQLDDEYETAKAELQAEETAAELALLAAKRASKDAANFDSAFVVAYKFEYNRQMVNEIADAAWTGEWTFRTIDSIIKVNKLAVSGDSIASKYSKNSALAFNAAVGNAFTNEPDFRAALKVLSAIYKTTTKTTLKF